MRSTPVLDAALGVATLATMGFAAVAVARPHLLPGTDVERAGRYYADMYAARALPLGVAVLTALRHPDAHARLVLLAAAGAQALDAAVGVRHGVWRQVPAPLVLAAGYTARAWRG